MSIIQQLTSQLSLMWKHEIVTMQGDLSFMHSFVFNKFVSLSVTIQLQELHSTLHTYYVEMFHFNSICHILPPMMTMKLCKYASLQPLIDDIGPNLTLANTFHGYVFVVYIMLSLDPIMMNMFKTLQLRFNYIHIQLFQLIIVKYMLHASYCLLPTYRQQVDIEITLL